MKLSPNRPAGTDQRTLGGCVLEVSELTKGLTNRQEKIEAIFRFVSQDVRYMGINYEIAYVIYEVKEKLIVVLLAGTRENFYDELKRYIK